MMNIFFSGRLWECKGRNMWRPASEKVRWHFENPCAILCQFFRLLWSQKPNAAIRSPWPQAQAQQSWCQSPCGGGRARLDTREKGGTKTCHKMCCVSTSFQIPHPKPLHGQPSISGFLLWVLAPGSHAHTVVKSFSTQLFPPAFKVDSDPDIDGGPCDDIEAVGHAPWWKLSSPELHAFPSPKDHRTCNQCNLVSSSFYWDLKPAADSDTDLLLLWPVFVLAMVRGDDFNTGQGLLAATARWELGDLGLVTAGPLQGCSTWISTLSSILPPLAIWWPARLCLLAQLAGRSQARISSRSYLSQEVGS